VCGYFGKRARRKKGVAGSTPAWVGNGPVAESSSRMRLPPLINFEGSESTVTSGNARKCPGSNPDTVFAFLPRPFLQAVRPQILHVGGSSPPALRRIAQLVEQNPTWTARSGRMLWPAILLQFLNHRFPAFPGYPARPFLAGTIHKRRPSWPNSVFSRFFPARPLCPTR
jgi:hypothetical protein